MVPTWTNDAAAALTVEFAAAEVTLAVDMAEPAVRVAVEAMAEVVEFTATGALMGCRRSAVSNVYVRPDLMLCGDLSTIKAKIENSAGYEFWRWRRNTHSEGQEMITHVAGSLAGSSTRRSGSLEVRGSANFLEARSKERLVGGVGAEALDLSGPGQSGTGRGGKNSSVTRIDTGESRGWS